MESGGARLLLLLMSVDKLCRKCLMANYDLPFQSAILVYDTVLSLSEFVQSCMESSRVCYSLLVEDRQHGKTKTVRLRAKLSA